MSERIKPVSSEALDQARRESPQIAAEVDRWNNILTRNATAGQNPAWHEDWYRNKGLRNEVGHRFAENDYAVYMDTSYGVADTSYGVRHHLTIVEPGYILKIDGREIAGRYRPHGSSE